MSKTEFLNGRALSRSWLPPLDGGTALMTVLIGFMGFYVLYPLALIVINSFNTATIAEPPVYGLTAWREAFSEYGIWRSLWNSIKIGIVLQVLALPFGIFISWLLARTNILFPNALEFGFWISFFLPGLATTFGRMLMLDPSTGLINSWLRQMPVLSGLNFDIYSFWGIIWVHLVGNGISTKVMLMTPAFRRMDASMEEASRMSGASALTTLIRITVPAMTPVIIVVVLLSVIRIFSSFEIELLLGVHHRTPLCVDPLAESAHGVPVGDQREGGKHARTACLVKEIQVLGRARPDAQRVTQSVRPSVSTITAPSRSVR